MPYVFSYRFVNENVAVIAEKSPKFVRSLLI